MTPTRSGIIAIHLVILVSLVGCGFLKKKGGDFDAGAIALPTDDAAAVDPSASSSGGETADSAAGTTADTPSSSTSSSSSGGAAATAAANENDVAQFPDQTAVDNVKATTQAYTTNVRTAPLSGTIVTSLKKGTEVTETAQREKSFLVVFPDPKDSSRNLMGWVVQDVFNPVQAPIDAGPPIVNLTCPAGQSLLVSDVAFCGVVCTAQKDCARGQDCRGSATMIAKGKPAQQVRTCVAVHQTVDAGAPVPKVDAGIAIVDAGRPVIDAGVTPAASGPEVPAGPGNSCPVPYLFVARDGKCHKPCVSGVNPASICGAARCTAKCGTPVPVCATIPCG